MCTKHLFVLLVNLRQGTCYPLTQEYYFTISSSTFTASVTSYI